MTGGLLPRHKSRRRLPRIVRWLAGEKRLRQHDHQGQGSHRPARHHGGSRPGPSVAQCLAGKRQERLEQPTHCLEGVEGVATGRATSLQIEKRGRAVTRPNQSGIGRAHQRSMRT